MKVIGVDPGGANTGIVLREGSSLIDHALIQAKDYDWPEYLYAVMVQINAFGIASRESHCLLAVEDLNPPNPHMGTISVKGLMATAQVLGAITGRYPARELIPPGGHGSHDIRAYPTELVGKRETKAGQGKLKHCRSAWDVAGVAPSHIRLRGGT